MGLFVSGKQAVTHPACEPRRKMHAEFFFGEPEFESADPLRRDPQRWGVHSMQGFQLLHPGCWIVIGDSGGPRVYSDAFFHATFELVEEPTS